MKRQLFTLYICSALLFFLNCYTQTGSGSRAKKEKFKQLPWVTLFSHIDSSHIHAEPLPLATQENFPASDASNLALVDFINNHQPDTLTFLAVRQLASQAITETSFDTAALLYQKYHPRFPEFRDWLNETILLFTSDTDDLIIKNIGSGVNTNDSQYSPVMSYDGKTLFYCSQKILSEEESEKIMPEIIEKIKSEYRTILPYLSQDQIANLLWKELKEYTPELVYYSTWQPETQTWGKGIPLSNDINDKSSNQAPESISADNQTLVLFGNYDCPFKRGNIYYSNKTKDGWHAPVHYPEPINSDNFEASLQLTSDGLTALFVSDRPGSVGKTRQKNTSYCNMGWGNLDIYVTTRTDSGWNDPVNLGDVINTPFCENTPYLHPDGRTLYFASNGHPGFGGLDVYYAKRLSDSSWTDWSTPVNLGKAINTVEDEWGYRINTEGNLAYFSSEKEDGFGGDDIYVVEIPQVTENVITITGTVRDQEGRPLNADIEWVDISTGEIVGNLKSDIVTGEYFIYLPTGKNYGYYASKDDYFQASQQIDVTTISNDSTLIQDIRLVSIIDTKPDDTTGTVEIDFNFHTIHFDVNKFDIKKESTYELNRIVNLVTRYAFFDIEIIGHTDNVGSMAANDTLSYKRANAVLTYLEKNGVSKERITIKGLGERYPIGTNDTESGRKLNRRVEFKLIRES